MINVLLVAAVLLSVFFLGLGLGIGSCFRLVMAMVMSRGWLNSDEIDRRLGWWAWVVIGYLRSEGRVERCVYASHGDKPDGVAIYRLVVVRPMPPPEGGPGERNEEAGS